MTTRPVADRLGDFTADARILTITLLAVVIGVFSAFVALGLVRLIGFFTHVFYYHEIAGTLVSPAANRLGAWALAVPVAGGLVVGLMARFGSERIRGHGIPEALEAILIGRSRMSAKVAILKPLSSAISIGTGGPFGAEGPIIMTGGAFGSLFAQAFHLSTAERKTVLVAGAAGGMAAVFATPVASALLGVGYDTIDDLLTGRLVGAMLVGLLLTKGVIWALALGSGTSGGVLAPLLIMGGALGALAGNAAGAADTGLWAAIGMGATMGGTMRSPFTAVAFMLELTHDVNVLPSLFVACMAADVVTVLLMKRSILTEKVARRGYHVMREYIVSPLHQLRVEDVMERDVPTVPANLPLAALFARLAELDPVLGRRQAWVLVDDRGRVTGLLTRGDLIRALDELDDDRPTVLDAATRSLIVAYPDELLDEATARMLEANVGRLPVVSREDHGKLVGYLGRSGVMAAWLHVAREEHHREPGWLTEQLNQLRSSRTK